MRRDVATAVANQVTDWGHRGLVDHDLLTRLLRRYDVDSTMGAVLLRWLGFMALILLAMAVVGLIGLTVRGATPFLVAAMGGAFWFIGTEMAVDPEQRHATTGAVLVTLSLVSMFAALMTLYDLFGGANWSVVTPASMVLVAAAAFGTAYRHGLRWPLALAVLLLFHAAGNVHRYGGRGGYYLALGDERLTCLMAVIVIAFGWWHERVVEGDDDRPEVGFGRVHIVFGLLYANLTLWILSLDAGLDWVLAFTAAGIAQIVLGARLHDGRFTGFGIVFLALNIYTRLFETLWDDLSKGIFFALAGALAMAFGAVLEHRARASREAA